MIYIYDAKPLIRHRMFSEREPEPVQSVHVQHSTSDLIQHHLIQAIPIATGAIVQNQQEGIQQGPQGPLLEPCAVISMEPVEEPPRFTMPLRNQTVNDGDRVVLRVFYRGFPSPTVSWYFNSQQIHPSQDFMINVDVNRGESTLVIVEVFPEDEGEYTCKAENPLGTAVTHCHLFVKRKKCLDSAALTLQHRIVLTKTNVEEINN